MHPRGGGGCSHSRQKYLDRFHRLKPHIVPRIKSMFFFGYGCTQRREKKEVGSCTISV